MLTALTASLPGALLASGAPVGAQPATGVTSLGWLVVALPLLGAALLLLGGRRTDSFGPYLAVAASLGSFLVGVAVLLEMAAAEPAERVARVHLWDWVSAGALEVRAGLLIDPLSIAFVLLITLVGTLIHVYSLGYMAHDPDRRRFFAYLNLFVAAMLLLVLADSYLLLFVGWEGVGLASWLLIGFWNQRPAYATAANKAFVVNRVGDIGLILAMALMVASFGTLDIAGVAAAVPGAGQGLLLAIGLLLLLGACGKSAQVPLQSWLGDAMAGPTPVSALIHAATMVTAGVYLVVRSHTVFDASPDAQTAVAVVGAITLVYGAVVGCAKDDIKKALAASTMSQIGYMMLAAGLGPVGYAFAIFHLLTHGFFKAGMFLGAGSVMHGMDDQVDMRRFGGLSRVMKVTWLTFAVGWLAILGVPPFAGFFSKDKIIEAAFVGEGARPWVLGLTALLGAGVTAFYMSRLFLMTFHGRRRWTEEVHPHESPLTMTVPMVVLAVGSAVLGVVLTYVSPLTTWLEPVLGRHAHEEPVLPVPVIMGTTLLVVALGAGLAWLRYVREEVPVLAPAGRPLAEAARRDLYQDELNATLLQAPAIGLARVLGSIERDGIDGGVRGLTGAVTGSSAMLRRVQTGFARSYALTMLAGVVGILGLLWVAS